MKLDQTAKAVFLIRIRRRFRSVDALFFQAETDAQLSAREESAIAALSGRTRPATLSERRGALYRLQALRGDLPGPGDHDRGWSAPQRRHPPHHPLRHRHGQMHLLRLLSGSLPGRCHCRRAECGICRRDPRGTLLRQKLVSSKMAIAGSARSLAISPWMHPTVRNHENMSPEGADFRRPYTRQCVQPRGNEIKKGHR